MKLLVTLIFALCVLSIRADLPPPKDPDHQEEQSQNEEFLLSEPEDELERVAPADAPKLPTIDGLAKLSVSISGQELIKSINPYIGYYNAVRPAACCPRKWNYGCRSSSYPMPCFYDSNVKGWCCPIAPQIYARRCLCKECAVLTSNCVQHGSCARRYTKRWLLAVCWGENGWASFRTLVKSVPSSCFCKTQQRHIRE